MTVKQGITLTSDAVTVVDRIDNQSDLQKTIDVLKIMKQFLPKKEVDVMAGLAEKFPKDD